MARPSVASIVALVAILAIFVGNVRLVMGSDHASWKVQNGGGGDDLGTPITVHCHSMYNKLAPVTLQPGQDESYSWVVISYLNEAYTCDIHTDALTQSFTIWKHDASSSYLNTCDSCNWKVEKDGFYFQQQDGTFTKEFDWMVSSKSRKLI